jgi:hypothetical protein
MNALVSLRFTIDVPEDVIERLMGRPDDDSDGYYESASHKAEEWVSDDLMRAIEHAADEPRVEFDA